MERWGICATVKAPLRELHAFVAHHLALGADRIWLHFDDPDDPALPGMAGLPRTEAIACDTAYWRATCTRRPDVHENRQTRNIQRLCAAAPVPWIAHLDHDEFIVADRPVGDVLAGTGPDIPMVRMAPYEALHDPDLADDIQTARHFRGALRGQSRAADRLAVFGAAAALLTDGMLSHAAGKCFFRTGVPDLKPRIHGAFRHGARVQGIPTQSELGLLHFHAASPETWLAQLDYRLRLGAYRGRPECVALLGPADGKLRRAIYDAIQRATPEMISLLDSLGILRTHDLGLSRKVDHLLGDRLP